MKPSRKNSIGSFVERYGPVCGLALLLFLLFDAGNLHKTILSLLSTNHTPVNKLAKVLAVNGICIVSYLSVAACLLCRRPLLVLMGVLLLVAGSLNALIHTITGDFFSVGQAAVAFQDLHFFSQIFLLNWKEILGSVLLVLGVLALCLVLLRPVHTDLAAPPIVLLVVLALGLNVLYYLQAGDRRSTFMAYQVPIVLAAQWLDGSLEPNRPRQRLDRACAPQGKTPDVIVCIIDESATYQALMALHSEITKPGRLEKKFGVPVRIFKAHSAGNHSSVSNYVLRVGPSRNQCPDPEGKTFSLPTIFTYAKQAGYQTIFYDAQAEDNRLENFMTSFELADIDVFLTARPATERYHRDTVALEALSRYIKAASPQHKVMITLVKYGAHFPYLNSIPPQVLASIDQECRSLDLSTTAQALHCKKAQYQAALTHSVVDFLDALLGLLRGKDFAVVYTSDHGQNLASTSSLPHGSLTNVSECEISVPILVAGQAFASLPPKTDLASHFQIPPTIKTIMGCQNLLTQDDKTLWDDVPQDGNFIHTLFGKDASWLTVSRPCLY